jgi:hypothetical protein
MRRNLMTLGIGLAAVVAVAGFLLFSHSTSTPIQITYKGLVYGTMVPVNQIQVRAHVGSLRPVHLTIDGKAVWVGPGSPPHIVALELSPGQWDAYQL